jgi:vacuolar protein sorting-associated protein 13A/C
MDLIRAEIMIEASTIFVILSKSDEWPFEIENDTDYSFKFSQRVSLPPSIPSASHP